MSTTQIEKWPRFIADIQRIQRERGTRAEHLMRMRMRALAEKSRLRTARYVRSGSPVVEKGLGDVTFRNAVSRGRMAVTAALGENHPVLQYLVVTDELQNDVNKTYRDSVVKMHHDRRPLSIEAHVRQIERALSVAGNEDTPVFELAAAIVAATGRRPIEIFRPSTKFTLVAKPPAGLFADDVAPAKRFVLNFLGQAKAVPKKKTAGPAKTMFEKPYDIPVLADPKLVLYALHALDRRYDLKSLKDHTGEQLSNLINKNLGEKAKLLFSDHDGMPIAPKELRAAYARACYELYAPPKVTSYAYFSRILGHSEDQVTTALSYYVFYAVGEKREAELDHRAAVKQQVKLLEQQREATTDLALREILETKIDYLKNHLKTTISTTSKGKKTK